jgi:hypothetical protein
MRVPTNDYFKLAGDQVSLWLDPTGGICIQLHEPFNDPVELAEHEALELAEVLTRLVQKQRG